MIKTIIADDETWVCQLISGMIDWQACGFEVIGNAYDGVSLYQMIEERQPDLVISDIRMPGMDGLSVIKKPKKQDFAQNLSSSADTATLNTPKPRSIPACWAIF